MLSSQTLNAFGLALDIIGFSLLFALAIPALMRRNFVTTDRVGLDGVLANSDHAQRLMAPRDAKALERRQRRRQTCLHWVGGLTVLVGFALQLAALFVP